MPFRLGNLLAEQDRLSQMPQKNQGDTGRDDGESDASQHVPAYNTEVPISADEPMFGLFADSPRAFENSGNITAVHSLESIDVPPTFVGSGVRIGLPILTGYLPKGDSIAVPWLQEASAAVLGCRIEREYNILLGLLLRPWASRFYG